MAKAGLSKASAAMLSGKYDIVILDEINTAHFFHLITVAEIFKLIADKPDGVELVLTGRYAPQELIEAADLVTEMVEIKHYYKRNVPSRDGIEQ
jgi:cob(I)alamin adenosyltransferase